MKEKNNHKVLIITYYWPPSSGPGVQRWLKFCKYLPDYQYQTYVYTPENPDYPIQDSNLIKEVPDYVRVIQKKINEPYRLARLLSRKTTELTSGNIAPKSKQSLLTRWLLWIRGNLFIPDARLFWIKPSIRFLKKYLLEENIQTVITSGPPHSMHLIGLGLKKALPNLIWIADFRDPWTTISYHDFFNLSSYAKNKHNKLEKSVLQKADAIISTSFSDAESFKKYNPRVYTLTNGFDDPQNTDKEIVNQSKYINNEVLEGALNADNFSILHTGMLEPLRNPTGLWQVLADLCEENPSFREKLRIILIGTTHSQIVSDINNLKLTENMLQVPNIPHDMLYSYQKKASVLLLSSFHDLAQKGIIPGKLFEYLRSRRPILAFGPKESDIQHVLDETKAGFYFNHDDVKVIKNQIFDWFLAHESGSLKLYDVDSKVLKSYHRKNITAQLAHIIKDLNVF